MSFFSGTTSLTAARGAAMPGRTPSRTDLLGRQYQPFSNPFFDHANTYLPADVRSLFRYCRYYHMTHGIVNAIATKASEYSVTDIIIQHKDRGVQDRWEELLLESMNYRVLQFEINLDYHVYGNAFVSVSFPFRKKLICSNRSCGKEHDAIDSRPRWRYSGFKFWLTCDNCGQSGYAKSKDSYLKSLSEITLIRWNPEDVTVIYNEATGRLDYMLQIPERVRSQISLGRKDVVATMPEVFLEAAKNNLQVAFDRNQVFHMRRANVSSADRGWGLPLLLPVLKDAFYMQVMKKANEAALLTHILPQEFIYPQPATAGADPFVSVSLAEWKTELRAELARQRLDPAYTAIVPFPIGHQTIGGQGRSLLLMPEIQQVAEHIAVGMGFPTDLVFGNGNYAGTSVSMRMLENFFLANMHGQKRLLSWVVRRIGEFLDWPTPSTRFKPFKMADDLQRASFLSTLNQGQKVSDTTLLAYMDLDTRDEAELMVKDAGIKADGLRRQQLLQAEIQAEMMEHQAKGEARAGIAAQKIQEREAARMQQQQAPVNPQQTMQQAVGSDLMGPGGMTVDQAMQVDQILSSGSLNGVDMRPQPEVLPPRREGTY